MAIDLSPLCHFATSRADHASISSNSSSTTTNSPAGRISGRTKSRAASNPASRYIAAITASGIDAANAAALPEDEFDLDGDGDTAEPLPVDLWMRPRLQDDPGTVDSGAGSPPFLDMGALEFAGVTACDADLTSTSSPGDPLYGVPDGFVDVHDFLVFLDFFVAGDARADIDGNGLLDVVDFQLYLDLFAAGCA